MKKTSLIAISLVSLSLLNIAHANPNLKIDLKNYDDNNDQKISLQEFKNVYEQKVEKKFRIIDLNKDGFIDQSEIDVAKEKIIKRYLN